MPTYWVEDGLPYGRRRVIRTTTTRTELPRRHSHSHDSRRRDDTRAKHNEFLTRQFKLRDENAELLRENTLLRARWRACNEKLRRYERLVPSLEAQISKLESENVDLHLQQSRRSSGHYHSHYDQDEELRRLRYRNTKLRNENDAISERVAQLERELRRGSSRSRRRVVEEIPLPSWSRRSTRYEDEVDRLRYKLDSETKRNSLLEEANLSLTREASNARVLSDYYRAMLRHFGISTRV